MLKRFTIFIITCLLIFGITAMCAYADDNIISDADATIVCADDSSISNADAAIICADDNRISNTSAAIMRTDDNKISNTIAAIMRADDDRISNTSAAIMRTDDNRMSSTDVAITSTDDNVISNTDAAIIAKSDMMGEDVERDSNVASKIVKNQINDGGEGIPASVELINVTSLGGYYGSIKILSSVRGITDILVKNNPLMSPAECIKEMDVDGYIISEHNGNIVIKAETISEGETLAIDLVNTTVVFDAIGESVEAKGGQAVAWTLEIIDELIQGDVVTINGKEYIYDVTTGFVGEGISSQTAALASLLEYDLTDFDIIVNENIITCIQKIAGIGSIEIFDPDFEPDVTEEVEPLLEVDSTNVELKIDSQDVKVEGEVKLYPDDYGKPYIDENTGNTYVPLRMLCESLDFNVGWNADDRSITVDDEKGNSIVLKIGDTGIYNKDGNLQKVIADENGTVTTPLHIVEGRTYVQLTAFTHSVFNTPSSDIAYLGGSLFLNL